MITSDVDVVGARAERQENVTDHSLRLRFNSHRILGELEHHSFLCSGQRTSRVAAAVVL